RWCSCRATRSSRCWRRRSRAARSAPTPARSPPFPSGASARRADPGMPVAAQVAAHAAAHPDRTAVSSPTGDLSYGELYRRARETALPGGRGVGICLEDPAEQLVAVLAADLRAEEHTSEL